MTFGKCTKCEDLEETIGELRRTQETLETRIVEQESIISKLEDKVAEGRALFADLYDRVWRQGDDHDAQLDRMVEWAGIKPEED